MDRPWLIALLLVVLVVLMVLRWQMRRRMIQQALAQHPPESGRRGLVIVAMLFIFGGIAGAEITDNYWWLLLWAPAVPLGLVARAKRKQAIAEGRERPNVDHPA